MKISKSKTLMLSLFLSTLPSTTSFASGRFTDALSLAIDHFNADHSKDLAFYGPEFNFMLSLLEAVDKEVPAVAPISIPGIGTEFGKGPFSTLSASSWNQPETGKALNQIAESLAADCPYEKTTQVSSYFLPPKEPSSKRTTTVYSIFPKNNGFSAVDENQRRYCSSPLVTELAKFNLTQLTIENSKDEYSTKTRLIVAHTGNTWRDMEYVRKQLAKIPGLESLASMVHSRESDEVLIGGGNSLKLVDSSGKASMNDSVKLIYSLGWGDCLSGCMNRHTWQILVTPKRSAEKRPYTFTVKVLSESGSPIDEKNSNSVLTRRVR